MTRSKKPKAGTHIGDESAKPSLKELLLSTHARTDNLVVTPRDITRGSGNVFADLGYAYADERQTKLRLALAINDMIARRRLTQVAAAEKLGVAQPKVSALANCRLDGFSVERLMVFLTALDRDVEIVIRKKPRSRAGRISVVAA